MTFALIAIPTACYALAACIYAAKGAWPLTIVYAGYSAANVGLLLIDKAQK